MNSAGENRQSGRGTRLAALIRKESLQMLRDPSALMIAFVLPVVLLFLFAYAVSLDVRNVPVGLVVEGSGDATQRLQAAFQATSYLDVTVARNRQDLEPALVGGELRGLVVIPEQFEARWQSGLTASVQVMTDGTQPNTASFTSGYTQGVVQNWLQSERQLQGQGAVPPAGVQVIPRYWFNPELESRRALLPGAMAIVMTMIGTLLTALVVAREWERGTMEAIMSTPARMSDIILGKLLPYFVLGMLATVGCSLITVQLFGLPFRGSVWVLLLLSAVFLIPALGQGLLISALTRNQFIASQTALMTGFLPAFLLSGFLFEIDSMPGWIQAITRVVPARYFVSSLQSVFLTGNVWASLLSDMLALLAIGLLFFAVILAKTRKRLD